MPPDTSKSCSQVCDEPMQGLYHAGSKWAPAQPSAQLLRDYSDRERGKNVAGAGCSACIDHKGLQKLLKVACISPQAGRPTP